MRKDIYKAKIVMPEKDGYQSIIYVAGRWRAIATPYSPKDDNMRLYRENKAAMRAAEVTAKALGITLEWEVTK